MLYYEYALTGPRFLIEWIGTVTKVALLQEREVSCLRQIALIVQYVNNAIGLLSDQIQARLVVQVVDRLPVQALLGVLLLFQLEYMLVKVELQRFVGVVDAQLLKAVRGKVFEAEYVEDGDRVGLVRVLTEHLVHSLNQPGEQA